MMIRHPALALSLSLLLVSCGDDAEERPDDTNNMSNNATPGAPSLDNLPARAVGMIGAAATFQLDINDPDGDALSASADAAACGFEVAVSASFEVSWTCGASPSTCEVTITASDAGGLSDSGALTIVCEAAQPGAPSVSDVAISPSPLLNFGEPLTCGYTFSDPDGDQDASTIEWIIGGQVVAQGPSFSGYSPRDAVTCRVTPNDGTQTGEPVSSAPLQVPDQITLAAGALHTCAIRQGAVSCWGNGADGQLGRLSSSGNGADPALIEDFAPEATALSAAGAYTCAINAGALYCWGKSFYGALGLGAIEQTSEVKPVTALATGAQRVAAGARHACAIQAGALYCWGDNEQGQLGDGAMASTDAPAATPVLAADVSAVAAGRSHTCAIQAGALKCWGANFVGQLGAQVEGSSATPVTVPGLADSVSAVAARGSTTCAIRAGALYCWGYNEHGQVGSGELLVNALAPAQVTGLDSGVSAVAMGDSHVCAIHNKALKCWGYNAYGQLGDGSLTTSIAPVAVTGLADDVSAVAAGEEHSCAVQRGAVKCWGRNTYRQLGKLGGNSNTPVSVSIP